MKTLQHTFVCAAVSWAFVLTGFTTSAQSVQLKKAVVTAPAYGADSGLESLIDTTMLKALPAASLGEQLQLSTTLNLRSYGAPGTLITGAARGLSADHIAVFWSGVPLNSPSLGLTDLNSIPGALFDGAKIQFGGQSSRSAAGTAAAAIHLQPFEGAERVSIGTGFDNLHNLRNWVKLSCRPHRKWQISTRIQTDHFANQFAYNDPFLAGTPQRSVENNRFARKAVIQEVSFDPSERWRFEGGVWLQTSSIELPDIMGKYGQTFAAQSDSSLRLRASVMRETSIGLFSLRAAHLNEGMRYTLRNFEDGPVLIDSRIRTSRNFLQLGWQTSFGHFETELFAEVNRETVSSKNHTQTGAMRNLTGVQLRSKRSFGKLKMGAGIRCDAGLGAVVPVPDFHLRNENRWFNVQMAIKRIFRYPDLNELYWTPGGNPTLDPELGHSLDLTISKEYLYNYKSIFYTINAFRQSMRNLIVWNLMNGGAPEAMNLIEVQSKGMQVEMGASLPAGRMVVRQTLAANTLFTDIEDEVMLQFFPKLQSRYALVLQRKQHFAGIALRYIANQWRPTHLNTTFSMQDAVLMADAYVGGTISTMAGDCDWSVVCSNIGDVMDFRATRFATPGRVLSLNLQWSLHFKNNKKSYS